MNEYPECTVTWCTNFSHTKKIANLCNAHYQKKYRGFDPEASKVRQTRKVCLVEDCGMVAVTGGMCTKHYTHARLGKIEVSGFTPKAFPQCKGPKCVRPGTKKGLCATHYGQLNRSESGLLYELSPKGLPKCLVAECQSATTSLRAKLCFRDAGRARRCNLGPEEYAELVSQLECEACGDSIPLSIDHIHGHHPKSISMCNECIRGMLCRHCNFALGSLRDSPDRIKGLLAYAEKHLDKLPLAAAYPKE